MEMIHQVRGKVILALLGPAILGAALGGIAIADHHESHTTGPFSGAKVNGGTVTHFHEGSSNVLTLSDDFQVPDTPAPHWQVVDSKGNAYLLQRLVVKGEKFNKTITVPAYVRDLARVQIWCAWAETLLGEAAFDAPVR